MVGRLVLLAVPLYTAAFIVVLSLADGGFFRWTWPWATVALVTGAAGVALLRGGEKLAPLDVAFVVGLAALSAWQALSSEWSPDPERSLDDALRGTVYVAAGAAFLVLTRAAGSRLVILGVVAGAAATLGYGLVEHTGGAVDPFQGDLLFEPIGYANAVGILAAIAVILALGLLGELPAAALRAALVSVVFVSIAALLLTQSRGAWLAGGVGLATAGIFQWLRPWRWALRGWLGLVALVVVSIVVSPLLVEPAKLHALLSDRAYYWPVAWHALGTPFQGLGSGAFAQLWALERPIPVNAIDAHSLFLEVLLELGAVGLVVAVATLALPLAVAPRVAGGWAAGATGAYTAFLVHATVDWDWEMPVVSIVGLACGAALLSAAAPARHRRSGQRLGAAGRSGRRHHLGRLLQSVRPAGAEPTDGANRAVSSPQR
jgi:O-antigen ligase